MPSFLHLKYQWHVIELVNYSLDKLVSHFMHHSSCFMIMTQSFYHIGLSTQSWPPFFLIPIDMTIMICGQSRYGITTDRCRMDMLMDYFGEELEGGRCKKYDNKLAQTMTSFKHNCNIAWHTTHVSIDNTSVCEGKIIEQSWAYNLKTQEKDGKLEACSDTNVPFVPNYCPRLRANLESFD